ncbi:AraC family transcriptional regulator [Cohnella nanjingensis]|uniref:Helix-turn-helix transcriptional regulator n=1 Tax=Cohnella nanjingensis TaxID=1387779 RepID=A0A7X0RRX2_9BACL|nr:AraC family transcriptional regulator [Cohnella nanjingensis]MBB6672426.1 helix-turn-helix transcriptional regulator [Cohnella nanjingensis]
MTDIRFISPPIPHYILSGEDTYPAGGMHASRKDIGVFDLLIVDKGCLYMAEEDAAFEATPGTYLLLRPDRSHRSYRSCTEETHFYWVHLQTLGRWHEMSGTQISVNPIDDNPYVQINQFAYQLPRFGPLRQPATVYALLASLNQLSRQPYAVDRLKQQTLFQELLIQLLQETVQPAARHPQFAIAEQAAAFLRTHYRRPLSYAELSEAVHFHPNYIARCMKAVFGCTPLEYLTRYRIEQAKGQLVRTDEPVGRIAEDVGFGSFPFFVRCFAKHTGCRPREYRMRYREEAAPK